MGGEDHGLAFWHLIGLIDEDDATLFKRCHYMLIMDNLFTDI